MQRTLLAIALLAFTAAGAAGQVAVPELAPAGVRVFNSMSLALPMNSIVPENPAAMRWGAPSRIALGRLLGDKSVEGAGLSSQYDGSFAGFRWSGSHYALGAETTRLTLKFPPVVGLGAPDLGAEKKSHTVALSAGPDWLGIGISSRRMAAEVVRPPPAPPAPQNGVLDRFEFNRWTAGLSWRMGEHSFLGGGYGNESVAHTFPPSLVSLERKHYSMGLAFRGGGTLVWRLEADAFHVADLLDPLGNLALPGHDMKMYSVEFILGSWLLGGARYNSKQFSGVADTMAGYTVDFGYAPLNGFTLSWRLEHNEVTSGANLGQVKSTEEVNNVVLAWQF